jgi:Ca-activated chloride channel family protein
MSGRFPFVIAAGVVAACMVVSAGAGPDQAPKPEAPKPEVQKPEPEKPQKPAFTSGIDVVSLNVTVTDGTARYVTDLEGDAFSIFEDGVKQDLSYFNRSNQPIALALLLDTSASMEDKMEVVQEAAVGFARRVRDKDLATVIDFDSRVEVTQGFTNDLSLLEKAIRQATPGGSTSLHNAIYISLKELKKIQARAVDEVRRYAIVVLSDGEDTSSLIPFEEVLELAKRSETAIYAIGIRGRDVASNKGFKEAEFVLRQLAQETGGRAFFANGVDELAGVYARIAEELSSQYSIGYVSRNNRRDGAWRRIVVRVNRPNAQARTKLGYYAPTPALKDERLKDKDIKDELARYERRRNGEGQQK